MQRDRDRVAATGGDLVLVGMGTPAHARNFVKESDFDAGRLLVSRDRKAYEAMDLERASTATVLGPSSVLKGMGRGMKLMRQGRAPVAPAQQDWHQLGGAFVLAPGGELVWEHRSKDPADLPATDELLAALKGAAESSG